MTTVSRAFHDPTAADAAVQDLCDAGFELDDIDVEPAPAGVRVSVRAGRGRAERAAEVLDRHAPAARARAQPAGELEEPGPTTDDVRRERETAWSTEGTGATSAARLGAEMATNPRYGRADWTIVEPEARRQWLERGAGPWESVRNEVRSAWERTRGREA